MTSFQPTQRVIISDWGGGGEIVGSKTEVSVDQGYKYKKISLVQQYHYATKTVTILKKKSQLEILKKKSRREIYHNLALK